MNRREYLLEIARFAQSYGFVPVPIMGKHPRFRNWQNVRYDPADPEKNIRRFAHLYDSGLADNISIVTGEASGVVVVDVDKDSVDWWYQLIQVNTPLPETFTVQTGNDGLHIYFKYDDQVKDLTNANRILGQSIDFRTDGGVIIFPGSIHPITHKMYSVESGYPNQTPIIASMPEWLVKLLHYNQNLRK